MLRRKEVEAFLKEKKVRFESDLYRQGPADGALWQAFRISSPRAMPSTAITLQDTYITALSFAPRTPAFLRAMGLRPMPLGLDLRGGLVSALPGRC